MKRSIKHLPKQTQEELIAHHIPWQSMVVLYGSYARGGYVLWDEKVEFGVHTSYQSDYDIMIATSKSSIKYTEDILRTKVTPKYHKAFTLRRHASPQFIVEHINTLNKEELAYMLERTEILKAITLRLCTEKIASYDTLATIK